MDFGEDPAATVIRELAEETGLTGGSRASRSCNRRSGARDDGGAWHAIRIVYDVAIVGGELRDEVDESTDQAAWFTLAETRELPLVDLVHAALDSWCRIQ